MTNHEGNKQQFCACHGISSEYPALHVCRLEPPILHIFECLIPLPTISAYIPYSCALLLEKCILFIFTMYIFPICKAGQLHEVTTSVCRSLTWYWPDTRVFGLIIMPKFPYINMKVHVTPHAAIFPQSWTRSRGVGSTGDIWTQPRGTIQKINVIASGFFLIVPQGCVQQSPVAL